MWIDYKLFENVSLTLAKGVDASLKMCKKNRKSIKYLSLFLAIFYISEESKIFKLDKRISEIEKNNKSGIENA